MRSKKQRNKKKRTKSKSANAKKLAPKKKASAVRSAKKRPSQKKRSARTSTRKKAAYLNAEKDIRREFRGSTLNSPGARSSPGSEDWQGLSRVEQADSESVEELVEEGNLFEAGAVAGVEEADDADEKEVRTRELPEDDVPEEYLDKD